MNPPAAKPLGSADWPETKVSASDPRRGTRFHPRRVEGIDAIRFVCALWVVLFHGNQPPLLHDVDRSQLLWRALSAGYDCVFCGPAAVIVFFVLSGFCIHYPYTGGKRVRAGHFLARRYTRIGIPLVVVIACSYWLTKEIHVVWGLLLWSLYCELVYYTFYPALRSLSLRTGWGPMLAIATAGAVVLILVSPPTRMYSGMNVWDPVIGFPVWLLGCVLADDVAGRAPGGRAPRVWLWRAGAWAGSCLCYGLMLHTPAGFRWSLTVFAGYVYFWLRAEIAHSAIHPPNRWLERLGQASYSLYLTHTLAAGLFVGSVAGMFAGGGPWVIFAARLAFILAIMTAFYLLVEAPAHALAKRLKVSPEPAKR